MTIVVKSVNDNTISLPASLMESLHLDEGDEIKAVLDGETLRLSSLETFLALRGVLADDEDFDKAIELFNQMWQSWSKPASA